MTLEELIYQRIVGVQYGNPGLASFCGRPAVFFGPAPDEADRGWGDGRQYPRVSFALDLRANPERQTAGTLMLDVFCTKDGPDPEQLEPALRAAICGVIMAPDNDHPYAFSWDASETFESNLQTKTDKVTGVTISFDMYAFPQQITSDPDPVLAAMEFFRKNYPEAVVIGQADLPDFTVPTLEHPAVYCRMDSFELGRETHTVAWLEGVVVCHVFAPDASARLRWIRAFVDDMARRGEITMLDGSPMFLRRIRGDTALDPLSNGQIQLSATWGVLKYDKYAHGIETIFTS